MLYGKVKNVPNHQPVYVYNIYNIFQGLFEHVFLQGLADKKNQTACHRTRARRRVGSWPRATFDCQSVDSQLWLEFDNLKKTDDKNYGTKS